MFNCLLRLTTKRTSKLHITAHLTGESTGTHGGQLCGKRFHDDVIKWKYFPPYWPFVRGIHRSPVDSLHKGHWRGAFIFALICPWTNGWANYRDAGDLRRHHDHYDVTIMQVTTSIDVNHKARIDTPSAGLCSNPIENLFKHPSRVSRKPSVNYIWTAFFVETVITIPKQSLVISIRRCMQNNASTNQSDLTYSKYKYEQADLIRYQLQLSSKVV